MEEQNLLKGESVISHLCVCVCTRACVHACIHAWVNMCVCMRACLGGGGSRKGLILSGDDYQ